MSHRFVAVAPPHVGCVSSHSRTLLPTSVALPAEQLRRLSVRLKHLPAHFGAVHAPRDTESTPVVQDVDAAIEAMHQASFDLVSLSILAPSPAIPRRLASARETLRCAGSCVVCLRWRVNSLQPSSLPAVLCSAGVALPSFKELLHRIPPFARSQRAQGHEVLRELLHTCKRREVSGCNGLLAACSWRVGLNTVRAPAAGRTHCWLVLSA